MPPRGAVDLSLADRVLAWARGGQFTNSQAQAMFGPRVTRALYNLQKTGRLTRPGHGLWSAAIPPPQAQAHDG